MNLFIYCHITTRLIETNECFNNKESSRVLITHRVIGGDGRMEQFVEAKTKNGRMSYKWSPCDDDVSLCVSLLCCALLM